MVICRHCSLVHIPSGTSPKRSRFGYRFPLLPFLYKAMEAWAIKFKFSLDGTTVFLYKNVGLYFL